jgi:hypothetical protein
MGSEKHVCPGCGQPVDTVVRRHKTLGTWVPRWVAGPCRNPECGSYDAEAAESGHPVEGARSREVPATLEETTLEETTPDETTPEENTPEGPGTAPGKSAAKNS